jgi:hypothetical protein
MGGLLRAERMFDGQASQHTEAHGRHGLRHATPRHVGLNRRAHGDPASSLAGERMAEFASVRFLPDLRGIKKTRNSAVF